MAKDSNEAARWFRKAAEQGHAPAQSNLGAMHFAGEGMERNKIKARAWVQLAADQGLEDAKRNLAVIESQMTDQEKAEAMALVRIWSTKFAAPKTSP